MNNFSLDINKKLKKYIYKYESNSRKIAGKVAWYSLQWILKDIFKNSILKSPKTPINTDRLNIAIYLDGGLGDCIVGLNYIYYFRKLIGYDNISLNVFFEKINKHALTNENCKIIDNIGNGSTYDADSYDLLIRIIRIPEIISMDINKIRKHAPNLIPIIESLENFKKENPLVFLYVPLLDSVSKDISVIKNQKRIQQPDINGLLGITEDYKFPIFIEDEEQTLDKYNLKNKLFITINRSAGAKQTECTKLWPSSYCDQLVKNIKEKYPDIILVQLGSKEQTSHIIENIDMDYVGKTSFNELKILLKNSILHIDGEGGLVHLRHALHGNPSLVLFGPTSRKFFGYSSNINLRADEICPVPCEWVHNNWNFKCLKTGSLEHPCMKALTPEIVFNEVDKYLNKNIMGG